MSKLTHAVDLAREGEAPDRWDQITALALDLDEAGLRRLDEALMAWNDEGRRAPASWPRLTPALRIARELWVTGGIDAKGAEELASSPHLESLTLLRIWGRIGADGAEALAESPYLSRLQSLILVGCGIGRRGAAAIAGSTQLGGLRSLDLGGAALGPRGVAEIAGSRTLDNLEHLSIDGTLGPAGAAALADSPILAGIRELRLVNSRIWLVGVESLVASPHLGRLESLDLTGSEIGDAGVVRLAESGAMPGLQHLSLRFEDAITARGLTALMSESANWTLTSLDLAYTYPNGDTLAALGAGPGMSSLEELQLQGNDIEAEAIFALAGSTRLGELKTLDLSHNRIGPEGAAGLAAAEMARLETLTLAGNYIGDAGARALSGSPNLQRVHTLDLRNNGIGDAGITVLSASLPSLRHLDLRRNRFGTQGAIALAAAPLPRLDTLYLSGPKIAPEGWAALCRSPALGGPTELHAGTVDEASESILREWEAGAKGRRVYCETL